MLDQSSCRFYGRVAYDREFGGMFLDDREGPRLARLLADGVSTGRTPALIPDDIARLTCEQWLDDPQGAELHLQALLEILDEEEPEYRD